MDGQKKIKQDITTNMKTKIMGKKNKQTADAL